ncbi:hypothetical protein [Variovorax sp. GB1P17]|uniref:hypothetical protein n=1 Tax=Variovorax sp. GB1P17 TaxID=3443740 RepID=UPI003F4495DB
MTLYSCKRSASAAQLLAGLLLAMAFMPSMAQISEPDSPIIRRINMGPGCDIRLVDFYRGEAESGLPSKGRYTKIPPPAPSSLKELKLSWICISSDDSRVGFHGMSAPDPYTGQWILDWSRIIGRAETQREERWLYRWYGAKYKLIQLKATNSSGYAIIDSTQTDAGTLPGKSDMRAQGAGPVLLSFCLVRPPKALCGEGHVGQRQDGLKGDLTPYALKIIRSIEFAD